jgi:lipoprotein signal peptidase
VTALLGGLLGNLADGLRVGYPVDYFVVGIPCNLADAALILGGSVFMYRILKGEARS